MSGYEHEHEHGHFMPHSHSHRHQGEQPTEAHERSGMGPHHHTHAALTRREPLDVEVLDGPEALEKEAGRLLVAAAKARLERGGPNDAHEVRHLYAAIQYGNSDDETDGCRLDTQLVADYAVARLAKDAER